MKKLVVVLAAAVVVTAGLATNLWLDLRAENGKSSDLAARKSAAESAQLAQAVAPQPAPVAAIAVANPQPVATPAPIAVAPANKPASAGAANSPMKGMLEAMATPEGKDATRAMMSGMMAMMYPDVEQELGITAQQKQKLFELMADDEGASAELMLGAQDPASKREMQRKMVEAERAREAKVSALLGSKYPKWEEYQGTATARQQVNQLRATLSASGNPMSDAQSSQLVAAFATEQIRSTKETRAWTTSSAAVNSPDMMQETVQRAIDSQSRLLGAASPILNSAQLDRFKRQVEQQTTVLRATMGMMGAGGTP